MLSPPQALGPETLELPSDRKETPSQSTVLPGPSFPLKEALPVTPIFMFISALSTSLLHKTHGTASTSARGLGRELATLSASPAHFPSLQKQHLIDGVFMKDLR